MAALKVAIASGFVGEQAIGRAAESERELLARAREGEAEAFGKLVQRYRYRLLQLAWQLLGNREDAEDAVQDAFLSALEHLPSLREDAQVFVWLYRITVNVCKMRLRQRRCEPLPEEWELAENVNWGEVEARWWRKRQIDAVLQRLPEPLRLVLVLRELHDLRYDEIAAVLQISVGTVRSRLFEARKRFARLWEEMFGHEP